MSDSNDNNDNTAEDVDDKAKQIIEMLREAGVSTENIEDKKHAFWDTQVCGTFLLTCYFFVKLL